MSYSIYIDIYIENQVYAIVLIKSYYNYATGLS